MRSSAAEFSLPADYARVKTVASFHELVSTPFADGVNALCWRRTLAGDFAEVVAKVGASEGISTLDEASLAALELSPAGRLAAAVLVEDLQLLRAHGLAPVLDCIHGYPRDEAGGAVPTDVYSFHADSAPIPADTYLCSYTEAASEALRNEHALRRVDVPETRAKLLHEFGGDDGHEFREYLRENCYDLHFAPLAGAETFSFGLGNLWRIAIDYPGSPVPPCVHRAPETRRGRPPRLLLIS